MLQEDRRLWLFYRGVNGVYRGMDGWYSTMEGA